MEKTVADGLGADWKKNLAKSVSWLLAFTAMIWAIGFMPAILIFITAYTILEGNEGRRLGLIVAICTTVFSYFVFHLGINVNWIRSLLGDTFPMLRSLTGFL